jgi:hypothetical protein
LWGLRPLRIHNDAVLALRNSKTQGLRIGPLNASGPVSLLPPTVPTTFASWRRLALRGLRPFVRRAREKQRVTVTRRVRRRAIAGAHHASHPPHLACRDAAACRHVIAGSRVLSSGYSDPSTARAAPARQHGGPGLPVSTAFLQVGSNRSVSFGPSSRTPCQAHGSMLLHLHRRKPALCSTLA